MKSVKIVLVVLWLAGLAPAVALAQSNVIGDDQDPIFDGAVLTDSFTAFPFPNQVCRYQIYCTDATQVKISIADIGLPGDKWKATCYIYDKVPQKKTTISPGAAGVYSAGTILKNGGSTPLRAFVEIRYLKGTNIFSANGYIKIETNGTTAPTLTHLGVSNF